MSSARETFGIICSIIGILMCFFLGTLLCLIGMGSKQWGWLIGTVVFWIFAGLIFRDLRKKRLSPLPSLPAADLPFRSGPIPAIPAEKVSAATSPVIIPAAVPAAVPVISGPVPGKEETLPESPEFQPLKQKIEQTYQEIGKRVFGMREVIEQCMIALFSGGHVLCEGLPGLAKTTLAKTFSEVFACEFKRCQFSPDLLPSDLLGDRIYNQVRNDFDFQPGPVFTQILLADEINRSPAKTQAALLEVMQEAQVTMFGRQYLIGAVDGLDEKIRENRIFTAIATQNPLEQEGTYRLPEAQLDRFMFRLFFDWPDRRDELEVLNCEGKIARQITPCFTAAEVVFWKKKIAEEVRVSDAVKAFIVDLIRATRTADEIAVGAGPRASQVLLRGAKVAAAFAGRDQVTRADVLHLVFPVLNHRLILKPELLFEHPDQTGKAMLEELIGKLTNGLHE